MTKMADPGAGSSAGGPPAGAVVVPIDIEAAAPAAAPAAAAAGAPRRRTRVRARVTCAASAAARARGPAWTGLNARLAWAAALFLQGCAAAGLAFFAMLLPAADSAAAALPKVKAKACADLRTVDLRTESRYLLLAAAAQVLAATMGLLVPAPPFFAALGWFVGLLTAYRASIVLWILVACHGGSTADDGGAFAFHLCLFFAMLYAAFLVGCGVVSRR